jgi:hypothetical protein
MPTVAVVDLVAAGDDLRSAPLAARCLISTT